MASQKCLDNIKGQQPPFNRSCTVSFCTKISYELGLHCTQAKPPLAIDTPVISYDPDLFGPGKGGSCYCCCSCFASDTPIEARPGEFVMIQDINDGDRILAAGAGLKWKEARVKTRSGDITNSIVPNLYLLKYKYKEEKEPREVLVTVDHLFMMYKTKRLKAVQTIIPGDRLMTNDGKPADVLFVAIGEHNTKIQTIVMEGDFDGKNLDGHLLNANGIVTTDYAVQAYYETNNLDEQHIYKFTDPDNVHEVGMPEYVKNFQSKELDAFLDDVKSWPKGFMPKRKNLVHIPKNALSFVTAEQAREIKDNAVFNPYTFLSPEYRILYLFKLNRLFNPDTICIIDWNNEIPNAYAWSQNSQKFILFTGGLARVQGMYMDVFSLILSAMQSSLNGAECVGEADYEAVTEQMRTTWDDQLFMQIIEKAIEQVTGLFSCITEHRAGDPENVCANPAIDCRIDTYKKALSFLPIPDCAVPTPQFFDVKMAVANLELTEVTVIYSAPVEVSLATTTDNYQFIPDIPVTGAKMNPKNDTQVILSVNDLEGGTKYILTVRNVLSSKGAHLNPDADTVIIRTPKTE